ncbi:APC family permease [Sulfobacillus thermosulfidooxidans]|uniref:APC family permease n=1 Tax=Sulfobacillus thermosulfidooxidans TaxID=28034 RepID=UPI001301653E|nr:APC family permease [Sulfobacillus thermosulfidooxidans]
MLGTERPVSSTNRLTRNSLSTGDILGVSLANTAPAMSFFFSFAVIAAAAGLASPLAIVVAAIAVLLKINSLVEFTRVTPSTGSYISYIGKTFGAVPGVMTAWALGFGYIVAVGYVMTVMGAWSSLMLAKFIHLQVPWQLITVLFVLFVTYLVYRGVRISTKWAVIAFGFELLLILVSMIAMIVTSRAHLNLASLNPHNIKHGLQGIGLAFPLALFMFIGVGNPGAMVEETRNARQAVPIAIYAATIFVSILYVMMAWSTSIAFHDHAGVIAHLAVLFVTGASKSLGPLTILVYLAGLTSTFASLIGATNAQIRMIFSAGREGLLPYGLGKVSRYGTPWVALLLYSGLALMITLIWGSQGSALTEAGVIGTLGTIPIALVYLVLNLALPVYYLTHHRDLFSWWKHLVVPVLGTLALLLPLWGLIQPGQPAPFNLFPGIVLAVLVVGFIYAVIRQRQIPDLSKRVGSIIADE